MYTVKNSLDWLACGLFTTEEIISKLEERTKEIPQNVGESTLYTKMFITAETGNN